MSGDTEHHVDHWSPAKKGIAIAIGIGAVGLTFFAILEYGGPVIASFARYMKNGNVQDLGTMLGGLSVISLLSYWGYKHLSTKDERDAHGRKLEAAAQAAKIELEKMAAIAAAKKK